MPDLASCMTISILRFEHPQSREALDVDGADHGAIYWSTRINDLQLDGTLSGTGRWVVRSGCSTKAPLRTVYWMIRALTLAEFNLH